MKKILIVSTVLIVMLSISSTVFAGTTQNEDTNAGTTMTLDDGAASPAAVDLNFSPSVAAQYTTQTDGGNEQWYAIGTYHSGGALVYATSSQQTSIWKASRDTNEHFADTAIPTTEALSNSESQWNNAGFSR